MSGGSNNLGTFFKMTPKGELTKLHDFCASVCPVSLVQATDGNFYGVATEGGANAGGTVFEITPSGVLTVLYSFAVKPIVLTASSRWGSCRRLMGISMAPP